MWLYDKENCHRSLIHSGKAGTAGNIVSNTIKSMKKCLGVEPSNLIAVISCIRPPHYEEDIPTAIKAQLIEAGVPEEQIHDSGLDTAADTKRFYSYAVVRLLLLTQRSSVLAQRLGRLRIDWPYVSLVAADR